MSGLEILDLVIGLVFIYLILSLMCVTLRELQANVMKLRSKNLNKWFCNVLNTATDEKNSLGAKILKNKIIDGLTQNERTASYISKEIFVEAFFSEMQIEHNTNKGGKKITSYDHETIKQAIDNSTQLPSELKQFFQQLHSESYNNLERFKQLIGKWYDQAMERNAGTYKKNTQGFVLLFSTLVVLALNVDTIELAQYFYNNPNAAKQVAAAAEKIANDESIINEMKVTNNDTADLRVIQADVKKLLKYNEDLAALKLPIGWKNEGCKTFFETFGDAFLKSWMGWIVSILAVSLGAPFWFDTLNKLVNLRSAGRQLSEQPKSKKSESSSTEPAIG